MSIIGIIGNVELRKATPGSVGYDLTSPVYEVIAPGETVVIDLGFSLDMTNIFDAHVQIVSKSGLASQGLVVANSPGIVDNDYQGNIKVILHNNTRDTTFPIMPGQSIAQLIVVRDARYEVEFIKSTGHEHQTMRGDRGLGKATEEYLSNPTKSQF